METTQNGIPSTKSTSATSSHSGMRKLPFEFRGEGMEYFKIWIVNIFLTVITLGIYSAWATVRNNRYFYSNLYLDNVNFRYLAQPLSILKGRLIAIAALVVYAIASSLLPPVGLILAIALFFAIPYFINQSLAFKMRMSAYKNIQFRFKASYAEAFMVCYIWPILGLLTLGILYPLVFLKVNQYIVRNSSYGTTKFEFSATYKDYGLIFLTMIGVAIVCGIPIWAINAFMPKLAFIGILLLIALYFLVVLYFIVSMQTVYYSNLTIAKNKFETNISMAGLAKVVLINIALTVVTLGLYLPAAKVRMTKYIASTVTLNASDSLDNFAAAEQENISALGEEFGNVFDFGL